jgi:hypothetical protein
LVQTEEERKAKMREWYYKNKEKKKEYDKEYRSRPATKALLKKNRERPENIAKKKAYDIKPENKEKAKKREASIKYKKTRKAHRDRPEVKERSKKWRQDPINKKRKLELEKLPENIAKRKKRADNLKLKVFSVYSKRHSNSDIPCCRCCGENSHIDFLSVDHIDGRKHLPEDEQKLGGKGLTFFLKNNNYPEGFQILCFNCNFTKGIFGTCPHERMRKEETFAMMEEQSSFEAGF